MEHSVVYTSAEIEEVVKVAVDESVKGVDPGMSVEEWLIDNSGLNKGDSGRPMLDTTAKLPVDVAAVSDKGEALVFA